MFSLLLTFFTSILYFCLYYYSFIFIWCVVGFVLLYNLLTTSIIRYKLVYFFNFIFFITSWGFWFDLDGVMLIFLLTELMLIVVFYLVYTQLYFRLTYTAKKISLLYGVLITAVLWVLMGNSAPTGVTVWLNYYSAVTHVVSGDFFLLYCFFYLQYPLVLSFLIIVMGLFSIFFIFFYFNLKALLSLPLTLKKSLLFLRKQNLLKQANFKPFLRSFKY